MPIEFGGDAAASFGRASAATRDDAAQVLEFLSSGFVTTWFSEKAPRLWLAVLKPNDNTREYFSLTREYLLIGHGFPKDFQQRTLLAEPPEDIAYRLDPSIRFVSSSAETMRAACAAWAVQNRLAIVPIDRGTGARLTRGTEELYALLSDSLWRRDVFDDSEPVVQPSEFFGRELVVQELVSRVYLGQLAALFGLRKIGKSSVLRRVRDLLDADGLHLCVSAVVQCNATRIKSGRWSVVLLDLLNAWSEAINRRSAAAGLGVEVKRNKLGGLLQDGRPIPSDAQIADAFQQDVEKLTRAAHSVASPLGIEQIRLVAFFDEADEIYPHKDDAGYWQHDYFALWNTLQTLKRGLQAPSELIYVLFGVNPSGVEAGSLLNRANPLFELSSSYLKPLTAIEAKELLVGLGTKVGLAFGEQAVGAAFEISGGHPWLLRKLGSHIHRATQVSAAKTVVTEAEVRAVFERTKRTFYQHVDWILQHLKAVAPDEYRLLRDIAVGGKDRYLSEWADERFRDTFAEHLAQYGLVRFESGVPSIAIGLIRDALASPSPTSFGEQKKSLREAGEALEELVRLRISSDVSRERTLEEAVDYVVEAIPKQAKNRPKDREQLRQLGRAAGLRALTEALNWGDYVILLGRADSGIVWSGPPMEPDARRSLFAETIETVHLARHNNDSELRAVFDGKGFETVSRNLALCRESLGA